MDRAAAKTALQVVLATLPYFQAPTGALDIDDHRSLAKGLDVVGIILSERGNHRGDAFDHTYHDWLLSLEVWVRHKNDIVAARKLADDVVSHVIITIDDNPTLGTAVHDAAEVEEMVEDEAIKIGTVTFLKEAVTIRVTEERNLG